MNYTSDVYPNKICNVKLQFLNKFGKIASLYFPPLNNVSLKIYISMNIEEIHRCHEKRKHF